MTPTVLEAINQQVSNEFSASFSYLSMAGWCEHNNFTGAAAWLRLQSAEEHAHGMRLFNFLLARNHQAKLMGFPGATRRFFVAPRCLRAGARSGTKCERSNRSTVRLAFSEKVFAAMAETSVVHHRAGRGREDRARNRRQTPHGQP
jgi:ferritin